MGSLCDLMWDIDNNREKNLHNELLWNVSNPPSQITYEQAAARKKK